MKPGTRLTKQKHKQFSYLQTEAQGERQSTNKNDD